MNKNQAFKHFRANKKYVVTNRRRIATTKRSEMVKWTKYYRVLHNTNRLVDAFMSRSIFSVILSYVYRVNKGIRSKNIYSYIGDPEAHRLLNRSLSETLKTCLHAKNFYK